MFTNYLRIALRKLKRKKVQSFINITGLALGITVCCLLLIYIFHELSYDSFHEKSDRIYRVVEVDPSGAETRYYGQTAPPLGAAMVREFPEVVNTLRLYQFRGHIDTEIDGERFSVRDWYFAGDNLFEVFDFTFLHGSRDQALSQPNSAVLTKSLAMTFFGTDEVIGRSLSFEDLDDVQVTGVVKDLPDNSHLQFKIVLSKNTVVDSWDRITSNWDNFGAYTYVVLNESSNIDQVREKIPAFTGKYWSEHPDRGGINLQTLEDIYLYSDHVEFGLSAEKGNPFYIHLFTGIAIFVLLIAGINYTNLATANAMDNMKEIGVRKVNGALRNQLVSQFLIESILTALFAFIVSLFLIDILLPFFNDLTGKSFVFSIETMGSYLGLMLGITLLIGIISGLYPAFYLSGMKPSRNFEVQPPTGRTKLNLRQVLVVSQFAIAIILIVATATAFKQMNYIQSVDKGFEADQVVVVDINSGNVRSSFQTMKEEFERIPGVVDAAASSRVPGEWKSITEITLKPFSQSTGDSLRSFFMSYDEDMLELYGIELVAGSNFSGNPAVDSTKIILNRKAADQLGIENPVGKQIRITGVPYPYEVIGVTENFNYESLHEQVSPLAIGYWANAVRAIDYFSIKLAGGGDSIDRAIAGITSVHNQFDNSTRVEYHFLDQQLQSYYEADRRSGRIFAAGALFTILIACMGLFGLTIHLVQTHMKEIGIRKVLGATTSGIVLLLTKNFTRLVGISFLIAAPLAWIAMQQWLDNFAYRTELGYMTILASGLIAMLLAWITVGYQSLKAAVMKPVETLRSE